MCGEVHDMSQDSNRQKRTETDKNRPRVIANLFIIIFRAVNNAQIFALSVTRKKITHTQVVDIMDNTITTGIPSGERRITHADRKRADRKRKACLTVTKVVRNLNCENR